MGNPVWELLTQRRRDFGATPAITFIGAARTELSSTSLENAVAKLAGALREEWSLESGDRIAAYLPWHWQRVVWSLAAWSLGLTLDIEGAPAASVITVCGPDEISKVIEAGCLEPVVVSLHPFGLPIVDLPSGCIDAASVIQLQPDSFYSEPVPGNTPGLIHGGQEYCLSELIKEANLRIAALGLAQSDRLLISKPQDADLAGWLLPPLAPLLEVGSVVLIDGPFDRSAVVAQEGVTTFWAGP
ncbi:MAG: TIGR03089 family protein [Actinomycetota bacterium]|nr:TIGR03089 family protein [Actinomycetota bacterium]